MSGPWDGKYLFSDDLDQIHHGHDCNDNRLQFSVACHPKAGLAASYQDGVLDVKCAECGSWCARFAVAFSKSYIATLVVKARLLEEEHPK